MEHFIKYAEDLVKNYAYEHLDNSDSIQLDDFEVYCVWYCHTLGHDKALISTTLQDGMYYEVTYNCHKNEIYLDAYKKFENKCINLENSEEN